MSKRKRRRADATGRTEGDGKHVRLYRWMLRSPAWRTLSPVAKAILIELYDLYDGKNNGELFLSCRDAAKRVLVSKNLASRALHELHEHGFIRPCVAGAFDWKARHATTWILSEFEHGGQLPTKEFMRWQAPAEIQKSVPPAGQTVTPAGQMRDATTPKAHICPATGTDSTEQHGNLSRTRDTGSLPGRGDIEAAVVQVGTNPTVPPSPTRTRRMTGAAVHPRAGRTPRKLTGSDRSH